MSFRASSSAQWSEFSCMFYRRRTGRLAPHRLHRRDPIGHFPRHTGAVAGRAHTSVDRVLLIRTVRDACVSSGLIAILLCLFRPFPFVNLRRFSRHALSPLAASRASCPAWAYMARAISWRFFWARCATLRPSEIGETIMVSGAAQLLAAPDHGMAGKPDRWPVHGGIRFRSLWHRHAAERQPHLSEPILTDFCGRRYCVASR